MNSNGTNPKPTSFTDPYTTQTGPMTTRVISLRLPSAVYAALQRSAVNAHMTVSGGLDWLLVHSFGNCQVVTSLNDCAEVLDAKLDVRVSATTFEQLKAVIGPLNIPVSVYTRKLLYHFFVTKKLRYVQSNGRYTLAGCHD